MLTLAIETHPNESQAYCKPFLIASYDCAVSIGQIRMPAARFIQSVNFPSYAASNNYLPHDNSETSKIENRCDTEN